LDHKSKAEQAIIQTGIEGLDALLNGGMPAKSQIMVAGGPGSGKTLMVLQILYHCAKSGTPCAFISLDERPENIVKNFKSTFPAFSDIDELLKKKTLVIDGSDSASKITTNTESESSYSMGNLISEMEGIVRSNEAQIVVVDSLSFLKLMLGKTLLFNKSISSILSNLRRFNVTSILTFDLPYYTQERTKFSQELLLFDGMFALYKEKDSKDGAFQMQIVKMRGSNHGRELSEYSITPEGIKFK
jgi:circadian clock protein KaiC